MFQLGTVNVDEHRTLGSRYRVQDCPKILQFGKFKKSEKDDEQKDRISVKNGLESYCFNMKTTSDDEKMKDKISADDKKLISNTCDDAIKWLDAN